ncbi:nucleotidyltransferase domain-containing protein [bacterium]|nr:nucleotidyltransferase domain-containing protein [bacterium]MBU1957432.1 nucleotidyltransferase domain-containing protein [bacterium]
MVDIEQLKFELLEKLEPLQLEKIILFGSYAKGTQREDSDVDLYVVTNDNFLPKDFEENMNIKLKVIKALDVLTDKIAMDVIVHTKKMNEKFIELNSYFARSIYSEGQVLL